MRRLLAGLVAILSLSLITAQLSEAAVTPGTKCSKVGATSTFNGKKYTCVKSGTKLVWNKGVAVAKPTPVATPTPSPSATPTPTPTATATPTPTPTPVIKGFQNLCDPDPLVPLEWADVQAWGVKYYSCTPELRYVPGPSVLVKPAIDLSDSSKFLPIDTCKLKNPPIQWPLRGFPLSPKFQPTKRMNIQILATSFKNHTATSNPMEDHKRMIDLFVSTLNNISDIPINPVVFPVTKYIQLPREVEEYKMYEHLGNTDLYAKDVIDAWDPEINFTNVDYVLILIPKTVSIEEFNRAINFNPFRTAEKTITAVMAEGPFLLVEGTNRNAQYSNNVNAYFLGFMQATMIHEGIYHMLGLDDHVGDEKYRDPHVPDPSDMSLLGTGSWGNMSGLQGELITWDKWTAGLIYDAQVDCVNGLQATTHWLRPSSSRGNFTKMVVIPLSQSKAIVVESRRSTGYNFKFPLDTEGVLVYTVDTTETRNKYGISVVRPTYRTGDRFLKGVLLGDATLKRGESLDVLGYKISVLENGDSGDVVKVEKA